MCREAGHFLGWQHLLKRPQATVNTPVLPAAQKDWNEILAEAQASLATPQAAPRRHGKKPPVEAEVAENPVLLGGRSGNQAAMQAGADNGACVGAVVLVRGL